MSTGLPPEDQSCLDRVVERNEQLLVLKQAVAWALPVTVTVFSVMEHLPIH